MASDYEVYIRTDELLSLQKPMTEQINHDEMLFQVTHQASELWMKMMIQDLTEAVRLMRVATGEDLPSLIPEAATTHRYPALPRAATLLRRSAKLAGLLTDQVRVLETMAPTDYHQIRLVLGRGSGQDSPGFNRLLNMAQSLQEAYQALFVHRAISPVEILGNPYEMGELFDLMQGLLEFDQYFSQFRQSHLHLVRRQIGLDVLSLKGAPAQKLQGGAQSLMFKELWDAVSELTNTYHPTY